MDKPQRTVLITGCSTGIGHAAARMIAQRGFRVFGGVRTAENATELGTLDPKIQPILLDVTSEQDVARVVDEIRATALKACMGW